jgi:hypothetical protein
MMNRKNAGRAFIIHRSSFIVSGARPFFFFDRNAQKRARRKQGSREVFFLTRMNWDHTDDTAIVKMKQ